MALSSRDLRNFVMLASHLHFGRAALALGIAQSALSLSLARLEDIVGGRLLERGRRAAVRLTPLGQTFLAEAQRAVAQLDRAERIGRRASKGEAGPARLCYVLSAALSATLARALRAIREQLPLLDISAAPLETPEQIAALADARIDAGLLRPQPHYPDGVSARIVHREPLLLAVRQGHPLASRPAIRAADLAGETFIVPQVGRSIRVGLLVSELASAGGFPLPPIRDAGDYMTAVSLAAAGFGMVLAPRSLARVALEGLCYRPIEDFGETVELALAWHGAMTPLVRTILAALDAEENADEVTTVTPRGRT